MRRYAVLAVLLALAGLLGGPVRAQETPPTRPSQPATTVDDIPLMISAEEVEYDRERRIVTAKGNVEIIRDDRILIADRITYDQTSDVVTARGNVSLVEPTGEVIFADHVKLTGDMKDGIVEDLRIILSDGAKIAANGARRSAGSLLEMRNGVYSACQVQPGDLDADPLWQVKALKVLHDKDRQTIEYTDAWLELGGIPIAYTPYLSHPDPTVKRRSGLLAPSVGGSSDLGLVYRQPYYFELGPSADLTVTPILTAEEGPVLAGEYRQLFADGSLYTDGSLTEDSDDDVRGHVRIRSLFDLNDTWRAGVDIARASDDTYLRRYGFGSEDTLTTRAYVEGFRKRNYLSVSGYTFQGLRDDDSFAKIPIILPMVDYHHVGEAGRFGSRTSLDINFMTLTRTRGTDSRRFSMKGGWWLPYTSPLGDVYTLSTSLKGDIYHVSEVERGPQQSNFTGVTGRVVPELVLDWRYPFVRLEGRGIHQLVEPVVSAVVSPYGGNPNEIPNEDSIDFEFDDINLFSTNRFPGLDRVEGGPRLNYGLKWGVFGSQSGSTTLFVGQSYRVKDDDTFAVGSGLEENFSDIVTRLLVKPGKNIDLLYRARFSKDNFAAQRNELNLSAGPQALNISANYVFFDRQENSEFPAREELSAVLSSQITRHWYTALNAVRDLTDDGGMRQAGLSITYEDCCFIFTTNINRSFFRDRDIEPTDAITLRLTFKTLADVQAQVR